MAMKHSVATQKASYDLEAQLRLTEKAFAWAEAFAQRCDLQQEMPMEQDEGIDVDSIPSFDGLPEDEGALQEEPTAAQGSNIHISPASTPADMASLLGDSPPSSPAVVQPTKAAKRKAAPSAVAAAPPMASLKAMPREASKRQKKRVGVAKEKKPVPKASSASEEVYTIDRIIGGSKVELDAQPSFYLEWVGYSDVNWQALESPPPVDDDADYLGFQVQILKMGGAAEVLEQGARPSHKIAVMVVGELTDAENGSVRVCYEATGTAHQLDMHRCTLDGEPRDWLLCRDRSQVLHTDAVVDWDATSALADARAAWGNGKYYPSLGGMRSVLLHLGNVVMPSLKQATEKLQQLCLEIALFLSKPAAAGLPIVIGLAKSVRNSFMEGGFIRDCLTHCGSMERKDVHELSELAQADSDELAVAADGTSEIERGQAVVLMPEGPSLIAS